MLDDECMTDEEMMNHAQVTLADGRTLSYADYGPQSGTPVFYFHGFPGSRLDWRIVADDDAMLEELGIRVIAPDRPGYGQSDFQRGRDLLDWPDDVAQLADTLGIASFSVLGLSGGGPYAAACAYKLPQRVVKIGMVSSMGPADAPGTTDGVSWMLPGMSPIVRRPILRLTAMGLRKDPGEFVERSKASMAEVDAVLLGDPRIAEVFAAGLVEAFRQGIRAANRDARIYTRPWGFELQEIKTEVYLWHGGQDLNVPVSVARYIADLVPGAQAKVIPTDGHLTLSRNQLREILTTLSGT